MTSLLRTIQRWGLLTRLRHTIGDHTVIRIQQLIAIPMRRSLPLLALVYWSDKNRAHSYMCRYEAHLKPLRKKPIKLLEIGIGGYGEPTWGGSSLRMWRDYFGRGDIHGLDIEPKEISLSRVTIHQGDQSDPALLDELARQHGPFDVIIDDGSHINSHIRASFEALFPHVVVGGVYVIEDMGYAYDPAYGGGPPGTPGTSVQLVQELVDSVNRRHWPSTEEPAVEALHVYDELAVIIRGE